MTYIICLFTLIVNGFAKDRLSPCTYPSGLIKVFRRSYLFIKHITVMLCHVGAECPSSFWSVKAFPPRPIRYLRAVENRRAHVLENIKAGRLRKPYRGLIPACVSRRTEKFFPRITCLTARKRAKVIECEVFQSGSFIICHESVSSCCAFGRQTFSLFNSGFFLLLFSSL